MEQYLRRNRLSEVLDTLGMAALLYALAVGWFVWLWGLSLTSMAAGGALGTLLWMARGQWRRRNVHRREKALRSRIGGELMLEYMLLSEAKEAHFHASVLLAERWPITIQSATADGVLCRQGDETLLVQCIRIPAEGALSVSDLLNAQRSVRRSGAERAVLCVLGKVTPKVAARAEEAVVPLKIISRETMLTLAGRYAPATDAQLIELGKRKRPLQRGNIAGVVFRQDKAKRYHLYGLGMLLVYVLTGARLYAVPGMVCLTMAVMCRWGRKAPEKL